MHLGQPVAAEREGPPARRRHRPGQGRRRPDVARQRDRRRRVPVPLRRLRPRRPVLPRRRARAAARASWPTRSTIHNELVRTEPELAAELYAPFPYDFRGEQAPGAQALVHDADLQPLRRPAVRALHPPVHRGVAPPRRRARARRTRRARRWTASTRCAPTPQYHVSMTMQPGDMQFVNNYHVLHAREAYDDDRAAGQIRHLKRLWLETDVLADAEKPERVPPRPHRRLLVRARAAPRARSRSDVARKRIVHPAVEERRAKGKAARREGPAVGPRRVGTGRRPSRPDRAARAAERDPGARPGARAPRAHDGLAVHVLPGRGEDHGRGPRRTRRPRDLTCNSAATRTSRTSGCSRRPSARWSST